MNHGLMPASLQRLADTANTSQPSATLDANMNTTPEIIPSIPDMIHNALINAANINATYEITLTAQYSLRDANPSKLK